MTQTLTETEPEWQGAVAAMILLPISSHSLEFLVHWLRHTPHLKASIISSMCFTVVHPRCLTSMRCGAAPWLSAGIRLRLAADMRAMPLMIGRFIAVIPL